MRIMREYYILIICLTGWWKVSNFRMNWYKDGDHKIMIDIFKHPYMLVCYIFVEKSLRKGSNTAYKNIDKNKGHIEIGSYHHFYHWKIINIKIVWSSYYTTRSVLSWSIQLEHGGLWNTPATVIQASLPSAPHTITVWTAWLGLDQCELGTSGQWRKTRFTTDQV